MGACRDFYSPLFYVLLYFRFFLYYINVYKNVYGMQNIKEGGVVCLVV